jgi:proline iminopeptidase
MTHAATDRDAPGVRMIPIGTPVGEFEVWTRTTGDTSGLVVLVLHGGPGADHEGYLDLERPILDAGFGVVFYDQLGSTYSDQPDDTALWDIERFVDEVEQVRVALGLDSDQLVLYGQSWGGLLGIEYALAHHEHLKALVLSNMMSSIPAYNEYAERVLIPTIDPDVVARIRDFETTGRTDDPAYEDLLIEHYYVHHVLRLPPEEWPPHVTRMFEHINHAIYDPMQGPSELGASGRLVEWDRSADLHRITVPTLVIGAQHDTMDPAHLRWMADQLPAGRYLHCPDGSHLALVDDHDVYVGGLVAFLEDLSARAADA